MIFLASVAATLVFFDHSGDIIHINISTSVGFFLLFITTFLTSIGPYHMFYIIIYVALKLTEHVNCLYSAFT